MINKTRLSVFILLGHLLFTGMSASRAAGEMNESIGFSAPDEELTITLQIPVFTEDFSETPVAVVNEEPIRLWELRKQLAAMHAPMEMEGKATGAAMDYRKMLDRLIETRLILQEARNIGLHELDGIRTELADFEKKALYGALMAHHLRDTDPDPAEVEKLYQRLSRELLLWPLQFKERRVANSFLEKHREGVDFNDLAAEFIQEGLAEGEIDETYLKLKDFQPRVAMELLDQEPGYVSQVIQNEAGPVIFRIEESRFIEDPEVRQEAHRKILDQARMKKAEQYTEELEERYATIDQALFDELDLAAESVDFEALLQDERILAKVSGEEPAAITVAELARKVKATVFHDLERAIRSGKLNKEKKTIFHNMLFEIIAPREARKLGLDQTREYQFKLKEQMNALLFGAFLDKVVIPGLKVDEEEMEEYYEQHLDEFSTPVMLRLRSLVLDREASAREALAKLRKGADFKWVSANAAGLVASGAKGVLPLDQSLLSLTALPEELRELLADREQGDSLLYAAGDYFYVLQITEVYPGAPSPYEQVRSDIRNRLFVGKIRQAVEKYTEELKKAYDTRVFVKAIE